VPIHRLTVT